MKHVFTTKARLGSGGGKGDGCSLKAFTVSGDVVLTAVELVIHGKKQDSDGATCLFLNPRTLLLEWLLFIFHRHSYTEN